MSKVSGHDFVHSISEMMMKMAKEDIYDIAVNHHLDIARETPKQDLAEALNSILVEDFEKDGEYLLLDEFLFLAFVFLQFEQRSASSTAHVLQAILNQYHYKVNDEDGEWLIRRGYFQILKENAENVLLYPYPLIFHSFLNHITQWLARATRHQKMVDLLLALTNIYGFFSYSQYVHVWNLYNDDDIITEESVSEFFTQIMPKGLHFYLSNKHVINDIISLKEFGSLYEGSKTLPWYTPSEEMIEKHAHALIDTHSHEYKALKMFFKKNKGNIRSNKEMDTIVDHLALELKFNSPPSDIMEILYENNYRFDQDEIVQEFLLHYQKISDNTRKWVYKGFTPVEIKQFML
ncbi:MAG TPA: hypothetical protein P5107_08825 [Thermotogota bacterium]|nr:hypothetical protein [Thermotogota bacterium]HRW35145.1 hypothetical protein [Thermotogota bacterium]